MSRDEDPNDREGAEDLLTCQRRASAARTYRWRMWVWRSLRWLRMLSDKVSEQQPEPVICGSWPTSERCTSCWRKIEGPASRWFALTSHVSSTILRWVWSVTNLRETLDLRRNWFSCGRYSVKSLWREAQKLVCKQCFTFWHNSPSAYCSSRCFANRLRNRNCF